MRPNTWGVPPVPIEVQSVAGLHERLDRWIDGTALLIVDAPSGYGKTTQLADWSETRPEAVVWVSGSAFLTTWSDAARALLQGLYDLGLAIPTIEGVDGEEVQTEQQTSAMATLYIALQRLERRTVLVIDEADRLQPFADLDTLEREAGRFPHLRTIVISSRPMRSDPARARSDRERIARTDLAWNATIARRALSTGDSGEVEIAYSHLVDATGGRPSAILSYLSRRNKRARQHRFPAPAVVGRPNRPL